MCTAMTCRLQQMCVYNLVQTTYWYIGADFAKKKKKKTEANLKQKPQCGFQWQVALSLFSLIDSTDRRWSKCTVRNLLSIFIQNEHGQWVNDTKGSVSLCLWQFSMPTCNFRLIGQPVVENNGFRQTDGQTEFSSFYSRIGIMLHL